MKQHTLKESFSLYGKGLHTGLNLTISFNPAPADHGYKIQRTDLDGNPVIDVLAENVIDTSRGTVVANGDVRCSTIEHAMSALYSQGVDNCLIRVNGPEFPILDGSARFFLQNIHLAGTEELGADRRYLVVDKEISFADEQTGSAVSIFPADHFSVEATIAFNSSFISSQTARITDMSQFEKELAAARTFVFVREIEPLLHMGLIKGGDLDNAIVIYERQMSQERLDKLADALHVPHKDATKLGYINKRPLQWDNEPARHKVLDIIGDMALVGRPIKGRIVAMRPGHTANNKFARLLRKEIK